MKKMFAALVATLMMTFGLVATTATPAHADCAYSSCIRTITQANARALLTEGGKLKIRARTTAAGNATPTGTMQVTLKRKGGGFEVTKTVTYNGGKVKVRFANIAPAGRYLAVATFIPGAASIYESSTGTVSVRVKKKP